MHPICPLLVHLVILASMITQTNLVHPQLDEIFRAKLKDATEAIYMQKGLEQDFDGNWIIAGSGTNFNGVFIAFVFCGASPRLCLECFSVTICVRTFCHHRSS